VARLGRLETMGMYITQGVSFLRQRVEKRKQIFLMVRARGKEALKKTKEAVNKNWCELNWCSIY
jgi:hypothetical protein